MPTRAARRAGSSASPFAIRTARGDAEEQQADRLLGARHDAERGGQQADDPPSDDDAERQADDHDRGSDERRLPVDGRAQLAAVRAERARRMARSRRLERTDVARR